MNLPPFLSSARAAVYQAKEEARYLRYAFDMLTTLDEEVPWYTGYVFDGLTITRKPPGWLLVVRSTIPGGSHKVTFYSNRKLASVWLLFCIDLYYRRIRWSDDRFRQ